MCMFFLSLRLITSDKNFLFFLSRSYNVTVCVFVSFVFFYIMRNNLANVLIGLNSHSFIMKLVLKGQSQTRVEI